MAETWDHSKMFTIQTMGQSYFCLRGISFHFMLAFLLLGAFSRVDQDVTDCQICENARDYGYVVYLLYGSQLTMSEAKMTQWCETSSADALDCCKAIAVDDYPSLVDDFQTGSPQSRICADWGYCPKANKAPVNRTARAPIKPELVTDSDHLFPCLKTAKMESEVKRLLTSAPSPLAVQAKQISSKGIG
jgi:hypothetical protein